MDSNPKISVVMICYNHEKYIGEAIKSILSQTYSDFEMIIVDDGSSDNTLKIIREYKDSRIIVVEQKNSGPSIAVNTGINMSRGEFIAFMSGDDVSFPNRLMTQIDQIEMQKADMLFCLPQIIGPGSNLLDDNICPGFFHKDFDSTEELYRQLFYSGNFLCAPSCFCRRTAIEKVGQFKRGLIQLQDFDYWIRACKKNLVIKLHKEPLIQYRYLYGENLSDKRNMNRSVVETLAIYRSFFDKAPIDLLHKSFGEKISLDAIDACQDIEIEKSFLFLEHSTPTVKLIGIERMILQLEDDEIYEKLRDEREYDTASFFQLTKSNNIDGIYVVGKLKKRLIPIRNLMVRYLRFIFTEGPKWTEAQVKQRIQHYLEQGDDKRAIMVAHGYRRFPPGPTIFATMLKVFNKILVNKVFIPILKVLDKIFVKKIYAVLHKVLDKIFKNIAAHIPPPVMEGVFSLSRMYDYSKQNNCIVFEEPLEKSYLKKPKVLGSIVGTLDEGEAFSPRVYVSIVNRAVITGGSNLVITQSRDLLSDEMMDFPTEDYGIKSPYISFRNQNKGILTYKKKPKTRIKEGILLSCDHDNNYFHWVVECLPKLLLIDDLKQFKDVPLLIPDGLHENLMAALDLVNTYDHPIIKLDCGVAYHVERLIFPSALSRVIDRYRGNPVFGIDMVLSQKWISSVADLLKNDLQNKMKPWRKVYLARRKGLRALGNQKEIERMLRKNKFEIVDLDGVSLDSQIKLFSEVSVIVAPTGAALTNMLLCQPGTKVIILMSNHEATNYYFWSYLGDVAKLDVKIIAGQRLFKVINYWAIHDDYVVDPNILLEEIKKLGQRWRVMEREFTLSRMYDYSKQNNCIVFEEPLEKIYLKKPKVLGSFVGTLDEGEAFPPRVYVSIVNRAVITGGSNLVITQSGDLLSDEMMDFPTEDYGIKSPYISFRNQNKGILTYKKKPKTRIKEGILLSCDHDNNYFHWLVECLPKLLLIDDLKQFKDVPLLIPDGLHENLMAALDLVNIYDHPIIKLDCGVAYQVERLIFPSALSRVIDRYRGHHVFGIETVLSQKWISSVADLLKNDLQNKKKPWRKVYLARRKGLRALGNQKEIERMLRKNKFEIVDLDGVSLDSQIKLFSEVSVIVAPTGAALTNMLLCQPGTKVIVFMSNHEATNYYFWSYLGDIAKLDYRIIACERLFKVTNYWSVHDDYVVDPNILLEEIKKHE